MTEKFPDPTSPTLLTPGAWKICIQEAIGILAPFLGRSGGEGEGEGEEMWSFSWEVVDDVYICLKELKFVEA